MISEKQLEIWPIGGCEHIGLNMTYIKLNEDEFVIDSGLKFTNFQNSNIQYQVLDYESIKLKIKSLVVTHGHEDHIGGIPWLLKENPDTIIYCSKFSKYLIEKKCLPFKLNLNFRLFENSIAFSIGNLRLIPKMVSHSIPETFSISIFDEEKCFSLFYSSDFRIPAKDHDLYIKLKPKFSEHKYFISMIDSTNILVSAPQLTESDVYKNLLSEITKNPERVFVTLFPSNLERLESVIKIAKSLEREIHLIGQAVNSYYEIIKHKFPEVRIRGDKSRIDDTAILIVSGCQGDHKSALSRIAYGNHSRITLNETDTFIFSSKTIPGNELSVNNILNQLTLKKCNIVPPSKLLHTSGHLGQKELYSFYNIMQPTHSIPIHGESFFIKEHSDYIQKNFPEIKTLNSLNNHSLIISKNGNIERIKKDHPKYKYVINNQTLINQESLREKRELFQNGIFVVSYGKSRQEVHHHQIGIKNNSAKEIEIMDQLLSKAVENLPLNPDNEQISRTFSNAIQQHFKQNYLLKPKLLIQILD